MLLDLFDIDGFYKKTINPEFANIQEEIDSYYKVIDLHVFNNDKRIAMPTIKLETGDTLYSAVEKYFREHNILTFDRKQMEVDHIQVVKDREYLNCFVYRINVKLTKAQIKNYNKE